MFYVHKNGQQWGPYSVEELNGYISAGNFSLDDLVFGEGLTEWAPARVLPVFLGHTQTAQANLSIGSNQCPGCGNVVESQQVICVSCGYNLQTSSSTTTATSEIQRGEESIVYDGHLIKCNRFVKKMIIVLLLLVPTAIAESIIFNNNNWRWLLHIPYSLILIILVLISVLVFKLFLSIIIAPKPYQRWLVIRVGLTYVLMTSLLLTFSYASKSVLCLFLIPPILFLTPHFFRKRIPRINGSYVEDWPDDPNEDKYNPAVGVFQHQVWNDGKLIMLKEWDREGYQLSLYKYGYKIDGTTGSPLKRTPLKYQYCLDLYHYWLLRRGLKKKTGLPNLDVTGLLDEAYTAMKGPRQVPWLIRKILGVRRSIVGEYEKCTENTFKYVFGNNGKSVELKSGKAIDTGKWIMRGKDREEVYVKWKIMGFVIYRINSAGISRVGYYDESGSRINIPEKEQDNYNTIK